MNEVSLADIAAVTDRNGYGCGNGMWGMEWLFALLILPMMWGGNGPFNRNVNGEPVTESALCNSMNFNNLENAVGRLSDQQNQIAMQTQRDMCTGFASVTSSVNQARFENQQCCCDTQKLIQQSQYENAMNTASINANTTAQVQKVLDAITGNRMADMQNQINQLQLQSALCGVPKFQPGTVYGSVPVNPFFGNWNNCGNCCGNGNI